MKKIISMITSIVMIMCAVYAAPMSAGAYTRDPNEAEIKYNVVYSPCSGKDLEKTITVVQSVNELPSDMDEPERYDENFFKNKFLIFLDESGSTALRYRVLSVDEGESTFDIDLEMLGDYTLFPADGAPEIILLEVDNSQLGKEISIRHIMSDLAKILGSNTVDNVNYYTGGLDIDVSTLDSRSEPYITKCYSYEELRERYSGNDLDKIMSDYNILFNSPTDSNRSESKTVRQNQQNRA